MLKLDNISKHLKEFSLKNISFTVSQGEYFILLGVSGAGKSMLLEMIAGLEKPGSGRIFLEGQDITFRKIQDRHVGMLFQDFAIFPHLSVHDNIAYSLHNKKITRSERERRILEISDKLSITHLLSRNPGTLSGGELQRIALARTLVQEPKILLLDEPLSAVDTMLKSDLRSLLKKINNGGMTILHVTHDYEEALSLGNRVAVIHDGEIVQTDTPDEVFSKPRSEFVAHFTGAKNFYHARFIRTPEGARADLGKGILVHTLPEQNSGEGFILIRSEEIILSNEPFTSSATNNFPGTIFDISRTRYGCEIGIDAGIRLYATITEESMARLGLAEEKKIWAHFKASGIKVIEIQ
jgi:molybdate transport system ATP-binding protein